YSRSGNVSNTPQLGTKNEDDEGGKAGHNLKGDNAAQHSFQIIVGTFFVVAFLSISRFNVDAVRAGAAAPVPRHGFDGCSGERWWTEVDLHVINKRQVLPDKSGVSGNDDGFGLYVYIFLRARDQGRF
ncbi:hypothetical protein EV126DRAFT_339837, partial [Verticillium dahliae]